MRQLDAASIEAHRRFGGRVMRRETLHLTLAFIGATPPSRVAELGLIAAQIHAPACDLVLDRLEYLPRKKIVWAGASLLPATLAKLAADLNVRLEAARFPTEDRPFAAHVTLLRNARCRIRPLEPLLITWRANEFALVESETRPEGASYRIIGRWPLDGH